MSRSLTSLTVFLIVLGISSPIEADLRFDRQRSMQVLKADGEIVYARDFEDVIFLGKRSVRHDMESESFIVLADEKVFLWLDHDSKTYAENPLPLKLEDLLTDVEKRCFEHFPQPILDRDAEASVKRTGEGRTIGLWTTTRLSIEGRLGEDMQFVGDRWITHDLEIDLEPYLLLVQNRAALSPRTRAWVGQLITEGGVPVETTTTWKTPGRQRRFKLELKDVREVEPDETRYRLPTGYTRVSRPRLDVQCVGDGSAR